MKSTITGKEAVVYKKWIAEGNVPKLMGAFMDQNSDERNENHFFSASCVLGSIAGCAVIIIIAAIGACL